jgi:hypothetical protein
VNYSADSVTLIRCCSDTHRSRCIMAAPATLPVIVSLDPTDKAESVAAASPAASCTATAATTVKVQREEVTKQESPAAQFWQRYAPDHTIRLVYNTGDVVTVPKRFLALSNLAIVSLSHDPEATELPVPHKSATKQAIDVVVEFLRLQQGTAPPLVKQPLISTDWHKCCVGQQWNAELIERVEKECHGAPFALLAELLTLADYMDIQSLLYLTAARIAWYCQGVPLTELPKKLSSDKPSTPTAAAITSPVRVSSNNSSSNSSTIPPVPGASGLAPVVSAAATSAAATSAAAAATCAASATTAAPVEDDDGDC